MKPQTNRGLLAMLIAIVVTLVGCSGNADRVATVKPVPGIVGVASRFSPASRPPTGEVDPVDPEEAFSYAVAPGQSFKGYYQVTNIGSRTETYLVLAFLDYRQVAVRLGGVKALQHTATLAPNGTKWWTLDTGRIPKGFHTYSLGLVYDPDFHGTSLRFRLRTDSAYFSANEANFIAGERSPRAPMLIEPVGRGVDSSAVGYDGVRLNKEASGLRPWFGGVVKPRAKVDYFIHVANGSTQKMTYALMPMLDYRQVSGSAGKPLVIFATVDPGSYATYRATFSAPTTPGIHELMVLRAIKPLTEIRSDLDASMLPSMRVPITVR